MAIPDGTTTLVYDNLFFFLAHGVDGLRRIVDAMRAAPAHVYWTARISPQSAYPDEAERFATERDRAAVLVAGGGRVGRDHQLERGGARRRAGRGGDRGGQATRAGGSRATTRAPPTTGSTSSRCAGISADHEAITAEEALSRLRLGHVDDAAPVLAASRSAATLLEGLAAGARHGRRLMFTTDGATPSFYAEHGVIGGALRIATDHGVDPMRALQMATIDPATYLGLDEVLGGIAPGRHATLNVLPEIGEWRPETVYVSGEIASTPRDAASSTTARATRCRARSEPVRAADRHRSRSPATSPRSSTAATTARSRPSDTQADARRPRRQLGHEGRRRELHRHARLRDHRDDLAARCSCSGTDPAAMARAAAKVADMGGGFAFDGGWSAPLEIDGLIAAGAFDKSVTIDRELSKQMSAAGYPFHDPLYSLLFASGDFLPEIRLTPSGVIEVKSRGSPR